MPRATTRLSRARPSKDSSRLRVVRDVLEHLDRVASGLKAQPKVFKQARAELAALRITICREASFQERPELPAKAPAKWLDRSNRKQTPVEFIRTTYAPWLPHLPRMHLRHLDMPLYSALYRYLSRGGELPADFSLPTEKEINTQALEQAGFLGGKLSAEQQEANRLYFLSQKRPQRTK